MVIRRQNKTEVFSLLIGGFAFLATQAVAQTDRGLEKVQVVEKAPTMVVSATRSEKALEDVPIPVEVITEAEIEQQNAKNLSEALTYAKGLLVQPIHGKTGNSIRIQGIDSDRILILVDGERVTASSGSTVDLSQIAVSDVEQIEIVKGASSALYGSSAMGGVVNVITKTPKQGFQGSLETSGATYGGKGRKGATLDQHDHRGDFSWRNDKYWLMLNADSRNSEGFEISNGNAKILGPDGYKNNLNFSMGLKSGEKSSLKLSQRIYREDHVIHDSIVIPGQSSLNRNEKLETDRTRLSSNWKLHDQLTAKLQAYVEKYLNVTDGSIRREGEIDSHNADLQMQWDVSLSNTVVGGINFNGESLKQNNDGDSELDGDDCEADQTCKRNADEFYLQLDSFLSDKFELLAGFRYQDDDNFGSHIAPKISAMYQLNDAGLPQKIRASVGNGYRVPNLKERYFIFDHSHLGYIVLGNPELVPEEIISYQLGYDISKKDFWDVEVNFFYNDMEKFIQTTFSESQTISNRFVAIYQYQNIARSRTYGVELSGAFRYGTYLLRANMQHLDSEDKLTSLDLAKNPEYIAKLMLSKEIQNNAHILIQSQYQSASFVDAENLLPSPSFQTWDLKYDYSLSQGYKLFAGVDNFTDEHRNPAKASQDLRPVPGRKTYFGMQYKF